jgi:hypothetical protein
VYGFVRTKATRKYAPQSKIKLSWLSWYSGLEGKERQREWLGAEESRAVAVTKNRKPEAVMPISSGALSPKVSNQIKGPFGTSRQRHWGFLGKG